VTPVVPTTLVRTQEMGMDEPQSDLQADTHDSDKPVDRRNQRRSFLRVLVVDDTSRRSPMG
jgi:hypothetical protein